MIVRDRLKSNGSPESISDDSILRAAGRKQLKAFGNSLWSGTPSGHSASMTFLTRSRCG
jgi:hypothetical protein